MINVDVQNLVIQQNQEQSLNKARLEGRWANDEVILLSYYLFICIMKFVEVKMIGW